MRGECNLVSFLGNRGDSGKKWRGHTLGISVWTSAGDDDVIPRPAHQQRAAAIHDVLKPEPYVDYDVDFGSLDDPAPRRLVELVMAFRSDWARSIDTSLDILRSDLVDSGVDADVANAVAALAERLRVHQTAGRLGRVDFHLADGNRVRCDGDGTATVAACRRV
jgi:hypothetical protein